MLKYYRYVIAGVESYEARTTECDGEEITKEAYDQALAALAEADGAAEKEAEVEESADWDNSQEMSDADRIAALEKENAALLYKLLTGEDLEDEE